MEVLMDLYNKEAAVTHERLTRLSIAIRDKEAFETIREHLHDSGKPVEPVHSDLSAGDLGSQSDEADVMRARSTKALELRDRNEQTERIRDQAIAAAGSRQQFTSWLHQVGKLDGQDTSTDYACTHVCIHIYIHFETHIYTQVRQRTKSAHMCIYISVHISKHMSVHRYAHWMLTIIQRIQTAMLLVLKTCETMTSSGRPCPSHSRTPSRS